MLRHPLSSICRRFRRLWRWMGNWNSRWLWLFLLMNLSVQFGLSGTFFLRKAWLNVKIIFAIEWEGSSFSKTELFRNKVTEWDSRNLACKKIMFLKTVKSIGHDTYSWVGPEKLSSKIYSLAQWFKLCSNNTTLFPRNFWDRLNRDITERSCRNYMTKCELSWCQAHWGLTKHGLSIFPKTDKSKKAILKYTRMTLLSGIEHQELQGPLQPEASLRLVW